MRTAIAYLCVLVLFAAYPSRSIAQVGSGAAWYWDEPFGAPILVRETLTLLPGHAYEFQTTNLGGNAVFGPDTVLTLRTGTSIHQWSLAGADGCGASTGPSCVTYTIPSSYPQRTFFIWVRARSFLQQGTCDVRYREVGAPSWIYLALGEPFGGISVQSVGTTASTYQLETTDRPGAGFDDPTHWSEHQVFFGIDSSSTSNWFIGSNAADAGIGTGATFSHTPVVQGTAMYRGTLPITPSSIAIIAGSISPLHSGPFRLLRNDCVGACGSAIDGDGDTLGWALEQQLLTCDLRTDPVRNGVSCGARPNCGAASSACNQSLRDSDGDGYRDDLELYGYQFLAPNNTQISGGYLPRYGANPAHYDLFVEMDYYSDVFPYLCTESTSRTPYTAAELASASALFTARSTIQNRDGSAGISAHFDGGVSQLYLGLPDTRVGNWGGTSCRRFPVPCSVNSDCLGVGGACDQTRGTCSVIDQLGYFVGARRWLFRSVVARGPGNGQTPGCAPLSATSGARYSSAGSATATFHELGHQGCLYHGGPDAARVGDNANLNPVHQSRVDYMYQELQSERLTAPQPGYYSPSQPDSPFISFSRGTLASLSQRAVSEICPLGVSDSFAGRNQYSILTQQSHIYGAYVGVGTNCGGSASCPNIDWNRDGVCTSGTVEAQLTEYHRQRDVVLPAAVLSETGDQMVVANGSLLRFSIEGQLAGTAYVPMLRMTNNTSMVCSETPASSGERWPACGFPTASSVVLNDVAGAQLLPLAVAASEIAAFGLSPRALVVWVASGPGSTLVLRYGVADPAANPIWSPIGDVPLGTTQLASVSALEGIPSLARIGQSSTALLVFRDSTGGISEQVASLGVSGVSWLPAPVQVINASTGPLVGAPAVATLTGGGLGAAGVVLVTGRNVGGVFRLEFYRRGTSAAWSYAGLLGNGGVPHPYTVTWSITGRPTIEARPYLVGGMTVPRLYVTWRAAAGDAGDVVYAESDSTLTSWLTPDIWYDRAPSASPMEIVWDSRVLSAPTGLRGVYNVAQHCGGMNEGPCGVGLVCTDVTGGATVCATSSIPRLIQTAIVAQEVGADGVVPLRVEDYQEWNVLQAEYCRGARAEGAMFGPAAYRESTTAAVAQQSCSSYGPL